MHNSYTRTVFLLVVFLSFLFTVNAQNTANTHIKVVIGSYTSKTSTNMRSEGIYTSTLKLSTGELTPAKLAYQGKDPTYLAVNKDKVIFGAFRENDGRLTSLKATQAMKNRSPLTDEKFTLIDEHNTYGESPCYLSFSPNENFLASANYNGANISIFRVSSSGQMIDKPTVIHHQGKSIHPRQSSPHPHWVQWSIYHKNIIYVIDLGTDQVMQYTFDESTGAVSNPRVAFMSKAGSGPRHLVFHPNKPRAFIVNELSNTIDAVNIAPDGHFSLIQTISTLPKEYMKPNKAAHIAINSLATHLYVSNRGLNSIAIIDIAKDGRLSLKENIYSGGEWPRFFKILKNKNVTHDFMLVGNMKSHRINVFKIKNDGRLEKTDHHLNVGSPTFIDEF